MVNRGACMAKGSVHGKGGVCGEEGACVAKGGGMCGMHIPPPFYEIRPVNARAVRILLECILVNKMN